MKMKSTAEMKQGRKSTAVEAQQWQDIEDDVTAYCRRHVSASQVAYGVCPACLHDRLSLLCPDCAHVRPCTCLPSTSAATSASSSLSSSYGSGRSRTATIRFATGSGSDKISDLIASEPAFVRSKSAGFALRRDGSVKGVTGLERSSSVATGEREKEKKRKKRWYWTAIWPFKGGNVKGEEIKGEKWKWWNFPSPIRGFYYRKSVSSRVAV